MLASAEGLWYLFSVNLSVPLAAKLLPTGQPTYDWHIRLFNRWLQGRAITADLLVQYLKTLKDNYCASTMRNKKAALKKSVLVTFHTAALDARFRMTLDAAFSAVKTPSPQRSFSRRNILNSMEVRTLSLETPERSSLFIRFLFSSGLRVSEMTGIQLRDCRPVGQRVFVRVMGKGQKEREVDVARSLYMEIRAAFGASASSDFLFRGAHGRFSRQYIWREIKKHSGRVLGRSIGVHALRHSHATTLIEQGAPLDAISERLGHADRSTTARYYLHSVLTQKHLKAVEI